MSHPPVIDTPYLRSAYTKGIFQFGWDDAKVKIVLVGSCRILPFLNYLRLFETPMNLICLNPVEMWGGPGSEVKDGVNKTMAGFRLGVVDFLICEHLQDCGVINTVRSSPENLFKSLGCYPMTEIRLPNWNDMHIFDAETAIHDPNGHGNRTHEERVNFIRTQTAIHKARWLSHCQKSSFPELVDWTKHFWLHERLGWSSNHPKITLLRKLFELITARMEFDIPDQVESDPIYRSDLYASTGYKLTSVDYEANHWKF